MSKNKVKGILIILFMLCLCLLVYSGHSKLNKESSIQTSTKTNEQADMGTDALTVMQTVNDKNVIVQTDDNYRTYYEMFLYSFYDGNGDGIGDLKGATEKLDYLNDLDESTDTDLGVNGIWLMPIMPSTTYHKYDVTDYYNIDPEYGNLEEFKIFIKECKKKDIHVIIDLVMNHTSSKHPWFQEAYQYYQSLKVGEEPDFEKCPYADYYNFIKEPKANYYNVEGTDWYYEAQFWSEMPDLNLYNENVRNEFNKITSFWMGLGVNGFRLDAIQEYETAKTDDSIKVLTWFVNMVKEKDNNAYLVGEAWNDISTYTKYYRSGIDSCFDFAFADNTGIIANTIKNANNYNATSYGKALQNIQSKIEQQNKNAINAPFYTNHDMGRSAGYYSGEDSEKKTKIAQSMNLLMSGNAFLYYGEEIGMKGSGKDENKRAPMFWTTDKNKKGMCYGPLDMDNVKMKYKNLEEQMIDGNSIFQFVRETIKLRNSFIEIARGKVSFKEEYSNDAICTIIKTYEEKEILIIYNISSNEENIDLTGLSVNNIPAKDIAIAGMLLTDSQDIKKEEASITLPAYSVAILK